MNNPQASSLTNILRNLYTYAQEHPGQNARRRLRSGLHIAIRIDAPPDGSAPEIHLAIYRHTQVASFIEWRTVMPVIPFAFFASFALKSLPPGIERTTHANPY
jgi:hypothetical protein